MYLMYSSNDWIFEILILTDWTQNKVKLSKKINRHNSSNLLHLHVLVARGLSSNHKSDGRSTFIICTVQPLNVFRTILEPATALIGHECKCERSPSGHDPGDTQDMPAMRRPLFAHLEVAASLVLRGDDSRSFPIDTRARFAKLHYMI